MSHQKDPNRPAIIKSSAVSGPPGPPGPPGPGITNVRLVMSVTTEQNVQTLSQNLQCDAGEIALGGGAQVEGLDDAFLNESRPLAGPDGVAVGWRATGRQGAAAPMTLRIGVICARVVAPDD